LHNVRIEKSNILLIGRSGSGKTHLVKSLASYLNVPLVIGDATSLTEAGYVGEDVESLLSKLIQAANGDLGAAQQGIVYIDEIDKLRVGGPGFKDMRLGVQHGLLKLLEGTVATVPPEGGFKHPMQPGVPFDTTNVLFICGGAFVGLEDIIARRLGRGRFGFGQVSKNRQVAADGLLRQVKPEDLEQFGLIPEIIGRLPVIAPLDALGVDDLASILQSRKGSLIQRYRRLVRFHGADLFFTDAAVKEIARIAHDRGTRAKGLRSIVELVLEPVLFDPEPGVRYVVTYRTVRCGLVRPLNEPYHLQSEKTRDKDLKKHGDLDHQAHSLLVVGLSYKITFSVFMIRGVRATSLRDPEPSLSLSRLPQQVRLHHPVNRPLPLLLSHTNDPRITKPHDLDLGIPGQQQADQAAEMREMTYEHHRSLVASERCSKLVDIIFRAESLHGVDPFRRAQPFRKDHGG